MPLMHCDHTYIFVACSICECTLKSNHEVHFIKLLELLYNAQAHTLQGQQCPLRHKYPYSGIWLGRKIQLKGKNTPNFCIFHCLMLPVQLGVFIHSLLTCQGIKTCTQTVSTIFVVACRQFRQMCSRLYGDTLLQGQVRKWSSGSEILKETTGPGVPFTTELVT